MVSLSVVLVAILVTLLVVDPFVDAGMRGRHAAAAIQAGIVVALAFAGAFTVMSLRTRGRSLVLTLIIVVGLAASLIPPVVWLAVSPGLASTLYQGLGVTSGGPGYGDLSYVLRALECAGADVDIVDPTNTCFPGGTLYGPALGWFGQSILAPEWAPVLGLALSVAAVACAWWLATTAPDPGPIVILIAMVCSAWILLLERGNLDAVVFIVAVAVALTWGRVGIVRKSILVSAIVLLALMKFYPVLLILGLIPFLRRRGQWWIIGLTSLAFIGYVLIYREDVMRSLAINSGQATTSNGSLGTEVLAAMLAGTSVEAAPTIMILVLSLALLVVVGAGAAANVPARAIPNSVVSAAIMGTALACVTLLVAGAGFHYKAVFLLLAVPYASYVATSHLGYQRILGYFALAMILISQTFIFNVLTATLTSTIAASVLLGGVVVQVLSHARARGVGIE